MDDVASAVVTDGATLALSAAMPGLVGAILRKAGRLASFRNSISHRNEALPAAACEDGCISLLRNHWPKHLHGGIGLIIDSFTRRRGGLLP